MTEAWKPLKNRPLRSQGDQFQYHNYLITIPMFSNTLLYHAVTRALHMHITTYNIDKTFNSLKMRIRRLEGRNLPLVLFRSNPAQLNIWH